MNSSLQENQRFNNFLERVQQHLGDCVRTGTVEAYNCTASLRDVRSAALFNGVMHSKAPIQSNNPFDLTVALILQGRRSVEFSLENMSFSAFEQNLEFAISQSAELEHCTSLRKQDSYPKIRLASAEMLALFSNGEVAVKLIDVLSMTDQLAAVVSHPRLMNREIAASFSLSRKVYFDSTGNSASEESATCSVYCAFALEDSSESHSDIFGVLPSSDDLKNIVDDAAKNLLRSQVRPLSGDEHLPVYLTHKAVIELIDQLVVPNLETRALIDKTGAWELDRVGEVVIRGLTIEDNPHVECSPFSSVFDFEGTATLPVKIMSEGRLVHPLMTSSLLAEVENLRPDWAGRFKLTGHAISPMDTAYTNVHFQLHCPPLKDLSQLAYIQIQNLTGMSLDPLTGQFALDADGAKVFESGKLKYSTSLTLRGNFFEALVHHSTQVGVQQRLHNQWAPSLFTSALSCVSKELAQTFEE